MNQGKLDDARSHLLEAVAMVGRFNHHWLQAWTRFLLGVIAARLGRLEETRYRVDEFIAMHRQPGGSPSILSKNINNRAHLEWVGGAVAEAERSLQESLSIAQTIGNQWLVIENLGGLAFLAWEGKRLEVADNLARQSLAVIEKASVPGIRLAGFSTFVTLGFLALERQSIEEARLWFVEALHYDQVDFSYLRQDYLTPAFTLELIIGVAHLNAATDDLERATELLSLAFAPRWDMFRGDARRDHHASLWETLKTELPAILFQKAWNRGQHLDLETVVQSLRDAFGRPVAPNQAANLSVIAANQTLPDPLTRRELEVLGLIAARHSNNAMAQHLTLSVNTIRTHLKNLYTKLAVQSRTQAIARARDLGLL